MNKTVLRVPIDPQRRGVPASQLTLDKSLSIGYERLLSFLIFDNNSYSNIGKPIPFNFSLHFTLRDEAIITDFMIAGVIRTSFGLVVTRKAVSFLAPYNLSSYQKYTAFVHHNNGAVTPIYWLYFHRLGDSVIDFGSMNTSINKHPYRLDNEVEFIKLRKRYEVIKNNIDTDLSIPLIDRFKLKKQLEDAANPSYLYLKSSFSWSAYDLCCFKYGLEYYVSDRLRSSLLQSDLTGFELASVESKYIFKESH